MEECSVTMAKAFRHMSEIAQQSLRLRFQNLLELLNDILGLSSSQLRYKDGEVLASSETKAYTSIDLEYKSFEILKRASQDKPLVSLEISYGKGRSLSKNETNIVLKTTKYLSKLIKPYLAEGLLLGESVLGYVVVDQYSKVKAISKSLARHFGYDPEEAISQSVIELLHHDDYEDAISAFYRTRQNPGLKAPIDVRIRGKDNRYHLIELRAENLLDDPGFSGIVFLARNPANRPKEETLLIAENRLLRMIAQNESLDKIKRQVILALKLLIPNCAVAIFYSNPNSGNLNLDMFSRNLSREIRSRLATINITRSGLTAAKAFIRNQSTVELVKNLDETLSQYVSLFKSNSIKSIWSHPLTDFGTGNILGCIDIYLKEERYPNHFESNVHESICALLYQAELNKSVNDQLQKRATIDFETGLPNREQLFNNISYELKNSSQIGIAILEARRLDIINDHFGHAIGDEVLKQGAKQLFELTKSIAKLYRFGGNEFALVIPRMKNQDSALRILNKVIESFKKPFIVDEKELYLEPIIGFVASYQQTDARSLIKSADAARMEAKRQNINLLVYNEKLRAGARRRLEIQNELRNAILNARLKAYFQPHFALANHGINGAEALIRLIKATGEILEPRSFLNEAQELSLEDEITNCIIRDSARLLSKIHDLTGGAMRIWINLTASQICRQNFPNWFRSQLKNARFPPHLLGIEVTEQAAIENSGGCVNNIKSLKALGIKFALDDFGIGYSSLSYLRLLPIDMIKLDKSFISAIGSDSNYETFLENLIKLMKTLNFTVLAEGVEKPIELEKLKNFGCEYAQGFLFCRPLSEEGLLQFLDSNRVYKSI